MNPGTLGEKGRDGEKEEVLFYFPVQQTGIIYFSYCFKQTLGAGVRMRLYTEYVYM